MELAVPGAFLYMVEWSACEGLILFSGLIGVAEQSTLGILLILMPILMCFTFGMQYAIPIYAGASLGEGNSKNAYTQARVSFYMVAFATILIGLLAIMFRQPMIKLFTELPDIQNLFAIGIIFLVIESIPDSNQFVL